MTKRKQNLQLWLVLKIISLATLSISGDRAIVGAPFDDDNDMTLALLTSLRKTISKRL